MGVPKFYRWISERYPCLSQVVKDYQIPEFDNFYLDMNGIIHACSHPNDDDPTFRISEDKIFNDIFRYIEALFRIIKPQKVMFLAVDGVAPRAKMNQQRGRRFRSAREAQDLVRKALLKGEVLPTEPRFDSNCITPGTDFMARLHEHLKYFVNKKLSSDPTWQKVEIILSGHDVPGEGEHKIMDYIRYKKSQPEYDPNTRHCLYGLDADLIMLGLVSHEPHFSLLREEVRFGKKNQKRQTTPDTITFHLLHLSIMREYLDFEFGTLKDQLSFGYDLERIIDDWVLMGFLVGNDFLPHLPNMHIRQDALPILYNKYVEVLPTLDGYINEGGTLHMERFETYLKALAEFDYSFHEELLGGLKWMEGKRRRGKETADKTKRKSKEKNGGSSEESLSPEENGMTSSTEQTSSEDAGVFPTGLADFPAGLAGFMCGVNDESVEVNESSEAVVKLKRDLKIDSLQAFFDEEDESKVDNFENDFTQHKSVYYLSKFGFQQINNLKLLELANCYVVGIQWVLHYYYSGVPSWSWFYPHHYAPYVSDIKGFSDIQIDFQVGHPFLPFEQLLAVLPPASKSLLPQAYQRLMVNEDSPVRDFYPLEFETDLNGKQMEWEAVVLIPFIDEIRLLEAMKPHSLRLTDEEIRRNSFGSCMVHSHDPAAELIVYPSPWPQFFPDITNCQVKLDPLSHFPFPVEPENLVRGLCQGVKLDVHFPGFPSLKHIDHTGQMEKRAVRVFQSASRGENLCLVIKHKEIPQDLQELAEELIGKTVYVGWPYLSEAMVHSISDGMVKYFQSDHGDGKRHKSRPFIKSSELRPGEQKQWRQEESTIVRQYLDRRGIDVGLVELIVYAQTLQGKRYVVDKRKEKGSVCLQKEWTNIPEPFAYQTTVRDITAFAPEYREQVTTLSELFPPKSHCFILSTPHYGSLAEVVSIDMAQLRVMVKIKVHPEPELDSIINDRKLSVRYLPSFIVSDRVGLSPLLLSRITGNIQVERGSRDNKKEREKAKIGLNWKFARRNQEILGYARKMESGGWSFSPKAVKILQDFKERFPVMFDYLVQNASVDSYYEQDLFPDPDSSETLPAVREWLKQLPSQGQEAVDCGSYTLDTPQIAAIEKAVLDVQKQTSTKSPKTLKLKVKPGALFKPLDHQGNLIPDPEADYYLFDRVINVSTTNAVPFGLRGTVMGIFGDGSNELLYEILFDEEFLGGLSLRCSQNRAYRLPPSCLLNITYGLRLEEEKSTQKSAGHSRAGNRSDLNYASAAASVPHPHSSDGPTPHSYPYFRSKFRFPGSSTVSDGYQDAVGYDAVDSSYSQQYQNYGRGYSSYDAYGQRSMEFVTRNQREPRFGQGRRRDESSSSSLSGDRGRRHRDSPGGRGQQPSTLDKPTPVLMQRKSSGGAGGSSSEEGTARPTGRQPSRQHRNVDKKSKDMVDSQHDDFSAALQALPKMKQASATTGESASSSTSPSQVVHGDADRGREKHGSKKQHSHGKGDDRKREKDNQPPSSPKKDKKRDLSPSVAAIFDAVSASQQQHSSSDVLSDDTDSHGEGGPSAALKSMLNIQGTQVPVHVASTRVPPPPSTSSSSTTTGMLNPRIPDALQKLFRGPAPSPSAVPTSDPRQAALMRGIPPPRGPLLPYPGYQQIPPPQIPLGGIPQQVRYPMPFGPPPAFNHVAQLHQVAQSAGHPKPELTIENTPQGCVGIAKVGTFKYRGLPCPNPEDAKQSVAAIAISNLPGAKMPLLPYPMYPTGPYSYPMMPYPNMYPPPSGSYNTPPPGGPGQYYSPLHRPSAPPSRFTRPSSSFVPLQVQRRQVHKANTEILKSKKSPSKSSMAQVEDKKGESKDKTSVKEMEEKIQKLSLEDVQKVDTKPQDSKVRESTSAVVVDKKAACEKEQRDAEAHGVGGSVASDDRDGEPVKGKPEIVEENLLKSLERVQEESEYTREMLKKLTGYINVLEATPSEVHHDEHKVASLALEESRNDEASSSQMLEGDMDIVARAAILASIRERQTEEEGGEGEGAIFETTMQPTETDLCNIVVVGDIVGPGVGLSPATADSLKGEESMMAPLAEGGDSQRGDQSALNPETETISKHVTVLPSKTSDDNGDQTAEESGSVTEALPAPPSSSHTPSKKSKRQLAVSFMNN